jgi:hypothetical protein
MILEMKSFQLNGWTIRPCTEPGEDGFDLVHGDELYHHTHLEVAVATAQRSSRGGESRTAEMLREGRVDPVRIAALWVEELKRDTSTEAVSRRLVVEALLQRIKQYENYLPSWAHAVPEDIDRWLHSIGAIPEDKLLTFYRWVGKHAVDEAFENVMGLMEEDPVPSAHRSYSPDDVEAMLNEADTDGNLYPSKLPIGHPFCDVPHHTHTDGGSRLPTCRLDSPE